MWLSFSILGLLRSPVLAVLGASALLAGVGRAADSPSIGRALRDLETEFQQAERPNDETPEAHAHYRDIVLGHAREARSILAGQAPGTAMGAPDSVAMELAIIGSMSYLRALGSSIPRTSDARQPGPTGAEFESLWNEGVSFGLMILRTWPEGYERPFRALGMTVYIGELLFAYSELALIFPQVHCFQRMATLPDSLLDCCLGDCEWLARRAKSPKGKRLKSQDYSTCSDWIVGRMAQAATLDALVGFRYGQRYWSSPPGQGPRIRGDDRNVASGLLSFAGSLATACAFAKVGPPSNRKLSNEEALEALRLGGRLTPDGANPFVLLPGLRDPRIDGEGRLRCTLVVPRVVSTYMGEGVVQSFSEEVKDICDLVVVDLK